MKSALARLRRCALAVTLPMLFVGAFAACRSSDHETWSFPCTRALAEGSGERPDLMPEFEPYPLGPSFCGGVDELPYLILFAPVVIPLAIDLVLLPVTGVHDLFWS